MKQKMKPNETLIMAIDLLEIKRDEELVALKEQFHNTYESLRPINILKNTVKGITSSPGLQKNIGSAVIGLASGYLVKNILFRSTNNPIKKLAGVAIETFIANLAAKNSGQIKDSGKKLFHLFVSKMRRKEPRFSEREIYK